jgi:hypothetical protein
MIGREYFIMDGTEEIADQAVLAEFIKQFYDQAASLPSEVLLPEDIEEAQIIKQWLQQRRGDDKKVEIKIPHRGKKKDLTVLGTAASCPRASSGRRQSRPDGASCWLPRQNDAHFARQLHAGDLPPIVVHSNREIATANVLPVVDVL